MQNAQIFKQMIQMYKTGFDSSFSALTTYQQQNEKLVQAFLDQAVWMPEEGKKLVRDWLTAYEKGCADYRKLVDENFARVEEFLGKQ